MTSPGSQPRPARRRRSAALFIACGIGAAFLLSGCFRADKPVPADRIKSVALYSVLPNTLKLSNISFFRFDDVRTTVDVDLGVNRLILADLEKALAPRYRIVSMALDNPVPVKAKDRDDQIAKTSARLKEIAKPGVVDAIVFAVGMYNGNAPGGVEAMGALWGSGYIANNGSVYRNEAGVIWVLEVFDGTSFEVIGYAQGGTIPKVDAKWTGEPYATIPDATKAIVTAAIHESVELNMPSKLKETGLVR